MNAVMLHKQYGRLCHEGVLEHEGTSRCKLWPPFDPVPAAVATKWFGLMTPRTFAANSPFVGYTHKFHFDLPFLTTYFSFVK